MAEKYTKEYEAFLKRNLKKVQNMGKRKTTMKKKVAYMSKPGKKRTTTMKKKVSYLSKPKRQRAKRHTSTNIPEDVKVGDTYYYRGKKYKIVKCKKFEKKA